MRGHIFFVPRHELQWDANVSSLKTMHDAYLRFLDLHGLTRHFILFLNGFTALDPAQGA